MKELVKGHRYELDNLHSETKTILQFYQDESIHGTHEDGPNCQEVLRALIARVKKLNSEIFWEGNAEIIYHLRMCIALFEARALIRKVEKSREHEKGCMYIEKHETGEDGHLIIK